MGYDKEDFFNSIQNLFRSGYLLKEWNNTFIALIPKKTNANSFVEFRPISLTNTCYKVISKLLANKLKFVLAKIISPNQTAFLEGRWINKHGVLAQEVIHTMNNSKSKKGWTTLKIDFSKAFDGTEWSFIKQILIIFGFSNVFVNWIMQYITSPTFSVLVNAPHVVFSHHQGAYDKVIHSVLTSLLYLWKSFPGCSI